MMCVCRTDRNEFYVITAGRQWRRTCTAQQAVASQLARGRALDIVCHALLTVRMTPRSATLPPVQYRCRGQGSQPLRSMHSKRLARRGQPAISQPLASPTIISCGTDFFARWHQSSYGERRSRLCRAGPRARPDVAIAPPLQLQSPSPSLPPLPPLPRPHCCPCVPPPPRPAGLITRSLCLRTLSL